ncbi:flagellar biosynthesis protein FlhF [Chromobacterium vaccinii]|uniref:Flagellar biosynthesis protein FlhF n=1 Tax=Chromobacterium vaccinii TaxID=1108595 RepID=A0A1D9LKF3_9NEIS|nr:flagellar biosynthesis protein FlhF [Chromobacterium vaccinii]AOZ51736.1 flagellar biosynthesis protein FlhF [Chromobacterium vaccinii]QND86805.1 Flagellar biosynthesis protein FlhF [Chromobacterium vaccinii]QND92036.1 Flagellar biosynthesis protein FlhF [Chromobacterium vaccinii]SUX30362.1 Flagella-associated GTP-binding protein [Chromobacterium vaccinii]
MVVKKFFGKTTRDALRQVREELGADALILSNRPTMGGGVEIMAVADADVANLASTLSTSSSKHPPRNAPPAVNRPQQPAPIPPANGSAMNRAIARTYAMPVEPLESPAPPRLETAPPRMEPTFTPPQPAAQPMMQPAAQSPPRAAQRPQPAPAAPQVNGEEQEQMAQELRQIGDEIKLLRSLLQSQLASFAWSDMEGKAPNRLELFKHLLAMGFSAQLIRQLIEKMPAQYQAEVAVKWARSALAHNLKCADADREVMDRGGIFALVGPTGVGKTTTVAKLAARATMRFGAQHVALITTDSYRIGAQDQLRIYGKILGVPVFSIQNEGDLQLTLADLSNRHIVFIDTVGMGQRDARVLAQIDMLRTAGRPIERLLLLAANTDGHTLEDVVKRYRGDGLSGCILSKIDEAVAQGPSLDVIIRNRLKLYYVTNGQRVPEDLHSANAAFLVDRAMRAQQIASPFALQADEMSIMQAAQAGWL